MRYYVAADVHGYAAQLREALEAQGYFADPLPHKLILCGDLFDRGPQAQQLQEFILEEMEKDRLILIRGNHEDLMLRFLRELPWKRYLEPHHLANGTVDTVCQLMGVPEEMLLPGRLTIAKQMLDGPLIRRILPTMVDFFETEHYIFVHGWIPCCREPQTIYRATYTPIPNWRQADSGSWENARWLNGMEAAHAGIVEPGKTIVCGHWHTSFGHARYQGRGGEFDNNPDFSPYYAPGIIALDACTPVSGRVNCIVIQD